VRRLLLVAASLVVAGAPSRAARAREGPASPDGPPDALRLRVEGDALVRVSREAVRRLAPAWDGRPLVATRGGATVPHAPAGPKDAVAFVAEDAGGRRAPLYELRLATAPPAPSPKVVFSGAGTDLVERRDDLVHGPVAAAEPDVYDRPLPTWWLHGLAPGRSVDVTLACPSEHVAPGPATVRVTLAGTHAGSVSLRLRAGERDLGVATVPLSPGLGVAELPLPEAPRGETVLRLTDATGALPQAQRNDASDDRGTVWIDAVSVDVPRLPHDGPRLVLEDGRRRALAERSGDRDLVAHRDPPDPLAALRDAEMAIVATRATLPGARRLAEHRASRGVAAGVVAAADVWDRFGGGEASPEALSLFLRSLPRLRFVLLCGDATLDRTDLVADETIPTAFARTKYNGATASDRALVVDPRRPVGGPAIGRLPFRDPRVLDAYVDRVVAYETRPPAHATRRLARFLASEGRFGAVADAAIELLFGSLVAKAIPPAYDVEVTFANPRSPFARPPAAFREGVVEDLNEGSLFHVYVGHGFARGFDHLWAGGRRFPILEAADADRVSVEGCSTAFLAVACTTAIFDAKDLVGLGEAMVSRPRGPVAWWGATRICHPVWNSLVGRSLAMRAFADPERRLGETIRVACDEVVAPTAPDPERVLLEASARLFAGGEDFGRLYREGAAMYALLGDPALEVAYPREDLRVEATGGEDGVEVTVSGPGVEDGAEVHVSVERSRASRAHDLEDAGDGLSPVAAAAMARNHARSNDFAVARATARAAGGVARATLPVDAAHRERPLAVKAWTVARGDVSQGATSVRLPPAPRATDAPRPPPR
jgi:hypothetical protein